MEPASELVADRNELNPTVKSPWVDLSHAPRRFLAATLAGQLALLALMVFAGYLLTQRLDSQQAALLAQHQQFDTTRAKVDSLTTETQALRTEVQKLRETVASHTGEDVLFLKVLLLKSSIPVELARTIAVETHRQSAQLQRDPDLVLAIMAVESDFNPQAVSSVGAVGLMQVMPHWKRVLGIQGDLAEISTNIHYGLQVLGFYLEMYGDLEMALTAYNRGPGPVDLALRKGQDARNGYAAKVLGVYERLKQLNVRAGEH
ncbi:MAG: transglycosylase SLT domain-containing protein [Myxococcota bacterium]